MFPIFNAEFLTAPWLTPSSNILSPLNDTVGGIVGVPLKLP